MSAQGFVPYRQGDELVGLPPEEGRNLQLVVFGVARWSHSPLRIELPLSRAVALRGRRPLGVLRMHRRHALAGRLGRWALGLRLRFGRSVSLMGLVLAAEADGRQALEQRHALLVVTRLRIAAAGADLVLSRHRQLVDPGMRAGRTTDRSAWGGMKAPSVRGSS